MKRDEGTIEKESCYYRMLKKKKKVAREREEGIFNNWEGRSSCAFDER